MMRARLGGRFRPGFERLGGLLLAVVSLGSAVSAADWKKGDLAVIVEDDVDFGSRDKTEARLNRGHRLNVTEVRDPWIGGDAEVDGMKKFGWVHKRQIKRHVEPKKDVPEATDMASARKILEELGAKLELDGDEEVIGVDASETPIPDAALAGLAHFEKLAVLHLSGTAISDAGLAHVGKVKALEQLYLDQTDVTDVGVKHLAGLENLDLLILEATRATGASLEVIKSLPSLRTISFSRCKVSDKQVQACAGLDGLEVLNLSYTQVTGDTFDTLQPLAKLRVLNVNGAPLKDEGLLKLSEQPTLKMLYIRETKIDDDTIQRLKATLNACAIYRY